MARVPANGSHKGREAGRFKERREINRWKRVPTLREHAEVSPGDAVMLVIARKIGQTIRIGEDIEVTISAIRGDQVRLAIQAPREIPILRTEIIGTPPNSSNGHVNECVESLEAVEALDASSSS